MPMYLNEWIVLQVNEQMVHAVQEDILIDKL